MLLEEMMLIENSSSTHNDSKHRQQGMKSVIKMVMILFIAEKR